MRYLLVLILLASPLFAGEEDINITAGPWRTNECYQYNNYWYGAETAPLSIGGDYFWGYEETSTYPSSGVIPVALCSGTVGRGFVFGAVADLNGKEHGANLAAYQAAVVAIPAGCTLTNNGVAPLYFSPIAGEETILYGSCNDGTIKKMDVAAVTPAWSETGCDWSVLGATYTGRDSATTIHGFDSSNTLVGVYGGPFYTSVDMVRCNVTTGVESVPGDFVWSPPTPCYVPAVYGTYGIFTANIDNRELAGSGHVQRPFDTDDYAALYDSGGVIRMSDCAYTADNDPFLEDEGVYTFHVDWKADADWFIGDLTSNTGVASPGINTNAGAAQYYFNRATMSYTEHRRFLTHSTARPWKEGGTSYNWNTMILPGIGIGKNAIAYTATEGKYSHSDYLYNPAVYTDWEPGSMWIAEISIGSPPTNPIVTTTSASAVEATMATSGGEVTSEGGGNVSDCGVAWGTSIDPTVAGSHTHDSCAGLGSYVSSITSLDACTTYYVRAWAINETATEAYGQNSSFKTTGCAVYAPRGLTILGVGN